MNVSLGEIPGGPEFIARCISSAADLALYLAGQPEEGVHGALDAVRAHLETELAEEVGAEAAKQIAIAFVATVARCRTEIEHAAQGAGSGAIQ